MTLIAPSGPHAGQPIWSCSSYPRCRGMTAADDDPPRAEASASIDARLLAVGAVLVAIPVIYLLALVFSGPR